MFNPKENEIIEAETGEFRPSEVKKESEPKRVKSDHSRAIRFWGRLRWLCFRYSLLGIFLSFGAGVCFAILRSQTTGTAWLPLMIVAFSMLAFFILALGIGFIAGAMLKKHKALDPNFENEIDNPEAF